MAYEDLLPTVENLAESLIKRGVSPETIALVFGEVGYLLDEHAQYHQSEYQRVGERDDRGAGDALSRMANDFESTGKYATAHYSGD